MNRDPVPPLLGDEVRGAAKDRLGRSEHQISVPQEVLQGGSGGGDAEDAARVGTTKPFDSDALDGPLVEGTVDYQVLVGRVVETSFGSFSFYGARRVSARQSGN